VSQPTIGASFTRTAHVAGCYKFFRPVCANDCKRMTLRRTASLAERIASSRKENATVKVAWREGNGQKGH